MPELQKLETESFWGNKAQIKLWNTLDGSTLDVQKKYIYSFSQKVVIESIKESVVFAQACLNNTPIDTLIKNKYVGIGQYNLSYNKNILSSAQGNPSVRIVDTDGKILYSSISLPLTTDSIFIENNMVYVAKKTHQKASLHVFDKNNKLICVPLENIGLAKGKNKKTYAFTYLGKPTDTLIIKLFDAKRKLLKEEKIFSAKLNEQKKNPKTTEKYFQIKEMYVSKRDELRTTCLVENTKGETLATIFDGRNIHSGINKVNYQLKHTLEEGETIFLIIKLNSGKIISKTALLIK